MTDDLQRGNEPVQAEDLDSTQANSTGASPTGASSTGFTPVEASLVGEAGGEVLGQAGAVTTLSRPASGQTVVVTPAADDTYVLDFDPNAAQVRIEGPHLVLGFDDDGDGEIDSRIVFENLAQEGAEPTTLQVAGVDIPSDVLVGQALALAGEADAPLDEVAAGPGGAGGGGSSYSDFLGDLLALLSAQGVIPPVELQFGLIEPEDEIVFIEESEPEVPAPDAPPVALIHDETRGVQSAGGEDDVDPPLPPALQSAFFDLCGQREGSLQAMGTIPSGAGETITLNAVAPGTLTSLFTGGTVDGGGSPEQISLFNYDTNIIYGATGGEESEVVFIVYFNDATGEIWFLQCEPINHGDPTDPDEADTPEILNLTYTITGAGGSTVGTIEIQIQDDGPTQVDGAEGGIVYENELLGFVGPFASEGTDAGNGDDKNADGSPADFSTSGSLSTLVDFGFDGPGGFTFGTDFSSLEAQGLTSQGDGITYEVVSDTLTATADEGGADERLVFSLQLSDDGNYNFVLYDQLDHPVDDGPNSLNIDFSSVVVAFDKDEDFINLSPDTFTITVVDDVPELFGERGESGTVEEEHLVGGNEDTMPGADQDTAVDFNITTTMASGSLSTLVNFGADEPGSFQLDLIPDTDPVNSGLTSGGETVWYVSDGTTLTAFVDDGDGDFGGGDTTIFTLELSGTNNSDWTFTLEGKLDHAADDAEDILTIDFSDFVTATDFDEDPVSLDPRTFTVDVIDDTPIANDDDDNAAVGGPAVSGNVLDGTEVDPGDDSGGDPDPSEVDSAGADGLGVIRSVTHDGVTYTLVDATTVDNDGGLTQGADYTFDGTTLIIETAEGGEFSIAMTGDNIGDYTYSPPDSVVGTSEEFVYALEDGDGDKDTATLTIDLDDAPNAGPDQALTIDETPGHENEGAGDISDDVDPTTVNLNASTTAALSTLLLATDLTDALSVAQKDPITFSYGANAKGATGGIAFDDPAGAPSGLTDMATGQPIALTLENGLIVGRVSGGDDDGEIAFVMILEEDGTPDAGTVDSSAEFLTVTYRAVEHDNPDDHDEQNPEVGSNDEFVTVSFTVTDADGSTDSADVTVSFEDDGPVAADDEACVEENAPVSFNLMFILDISGTMGFDSGIEDPDNPGTELSRLEAAGEALKELIDAYFARSSDVEIDLVTFGRDSAFRGSFSSAEAAKAEIDAIVADGDQGLEDANTNYEAALAEAQARYAPDSMAGPGVVNTVYFLSDGIPNVGDLDSTDIDAWEAFLDSHGAESIAVGVGSGIPANDPDLQDVAHPNDPVIVTEFADLADALEDTVPELPNSVSGNVLDNDSLGADGLGQIVSVTHDGETYTTASDGYNDTTKVLTIETANGVLEIQLEDTDSGTAGDYTYTPNAPVMHGAPGSETDDEIEEVFTYVVSDGDGDETSADLTICIEDGEPTVSGTTISATVEEEHLPGGNEDTTAFPDEDEDTGDNFDLTTDSASGSLSSLVDFGFDGPGGFSLDVINTPVDSGLTSGGETVWYVSDGETLTAFVDNGATDDSLDGGDKKIFELTVSNTTYSFLLLGQLDHMADDAEDILPLDFSSYLLATDGDGDPVDFASGTFTIKVIDDVPENISPDAATIGSGAGSTTSGDLDFFDNVGADKSGDVVFDSSLNNSLLAGATSGGDAIYLQITNDGHTLTGWADVNGDGSIDGGDTEVFTIVLNPDAVNEGSDEYVMTLQAPIDTGAELSFDDFSAAPAGQNQWVGLDSDLDINGDPIDINLDNNDSQDLLVTPTNVGGTVNTDNDDMGNGSQWIDPGEGLRIDFVIDVARQAGQDEDDPNGWTHEGHYTSDDFRFTVIQTQGNGTAAALVSAFLDPDGNLTVGDGAPVMLSVSNVIVTDENGVEVTGSVSITQSGNSVIVEGLEAGWQVLVIGDSAFNSIEIKNADGIDGASGTDFVIGGYTLSSESSGEPVNLNFDVDVVDEDGDTSDGTIDVTVLPQQLAGDGGAALTAGVNGGDLVGGDGNDTLTGSDADDKLQGGLGNDVISDGGGNDIIIGGDGADTINLAGDGDTDILEYNDISEGGDTVTGFDASDPAAGGDTIDLVDLLDGGDFTGTTLAEAVADGYVTLNNNGGNAEISVDLDGSAGGGGSVLVATLNGVDLGSDPTALDNNIVVD